MKKYIPLIAAILVLSLLGCAKTEMPEPPMAPVEAEIPETTETPTTEESQPPSGWQETDGRRYYLFPDGTRPAEWFQEEDTVYYFDSDGFAHTGWLELDGQTYYFAQDGTMVKGEVEIDGEKHHFTSTGAKVLLVNPWNGVPEDYNLDLVEIPRELSMRQMQISAECLDALVAMLEACNAEGHRARVTSAYRTQAYQAGLFNNKVARLEAQGYDHEEALVEAAKAVAVPGTSEHQLGLAVDIVDERNGTLMPKEGIYKVHQWLMEHCWEYGFILRYPEGKTSVTGIIYEPWHYRYVGVELAQELHELDLTLEEYLQSLTPQPNEAT